uniref:Uncharacterized protein n=1 Tax=Arundo donax TaxID=35708 RepID=A0A0A9DI02_ARUDO
MFHLGSPSVICWFWMVSLWMEFAISFIHSSLGSVHKHSPLRVGLRTVLRRDDFIS